MRADIHQRPKRHALRHDLPLAQNTEATGCRRTVTFADPCLAVKRVVGVQISVDADGNAAEQKRQSLLVAEFVQIAAVRSHLQICRLLHIGQDAGGANATVRVRVVPLYGVTV